MSDWKCTIRTNIEEVVFSTPNKNLKAILATIAEGKSKESTEGYILVIKEDITSGQTENVSIHWSDISFFSFEKINSKEE